MRRKNKMKKKMQMDYEEVEYFTSWKNWAGILSNMVFIGLLLFIASIFLPFCKTERENLFYWELPISACLGYCFAGLPASLCSFLKIRFLKNNQWRERYKGLMVSAVFCLCSAVCAIGCLEWAKCSLQETVKDGVGAVLYKISVSSIAIANVIYAILWSLLAKGVVKKEQLCIKK